jgi:type IV secretion system protein VirD4
MGAWLLTLQRVLVWLSKLSRFVQVYVLGKQTRLHRARFAGLDELGTLVSHSPTPTSLLLGVRKHPPHYFSLVQPTATHRELGNLLIVGPTRSGKGLLATSQLLSWQHSVLVDESTLVLAALRAGQ